MQSDQQWQPPSSPMILPPGWVTANDPGSGRQYFANPATGETQWHPPPGTTMMPQPPSGVSLPPPPPPALTQSAVPPENSPQEPLGLVARAQVMIRNLTHEDPSPSLAQDEPIEFPEMSAGMLADLCHIQQQTFPNQAAYTPVQPILLSSTSKPPHMEEGRLEIRLATLYDQLRRL